MFSVVLKADDSANESNTNSSNNTDNNGNPRGNDISDFCKEKEAAGDEVVPLVSAVGGSGITVKYVDANFPEGVTKSSNEGITLTGIRVTLNPDLKNCKAYRSISRRFRAPLEHTDSKTSQDRQIVCKRLAGITADWESCVGAVSMYDSILLAEKGMQIFQGVQTNNDQNNISNSYNQRAATGDGQNAAYDAQIASMKSAKALNDQQAAAYAAAVAALYSKTQSWIKESPEAFSQKGCGVASAQSGTDLSGTPPVVYASKEVIPMTAQDCAVSAYHAFNEYNPFVFPNGDAKRALNRAAVIFAAKAIQAGIKASQLGNIAKKVEEAKVATEDPYNPATFDYCSVAVATDPRCATTVTRTPGSGISNGDGFSIGDGFGNNAFDNSTTTDDLVPVSPGDFIPEDKTIADTTNPFVDDAKKAAGILDPAGAANIQPGTAGGGAGGGGGGSGGGGSASLDGDTPGADDSKKENDIKANKADGKYADYKGGSFQAVKGMKEENPFANLFDGKGGGKLEEDRSIASGDIDGQDSGIFAKISKRYGQVQADKRIEAKNLEE